MDAETGGVVSKPSHRFFMCMSWIEVCLTWSGLLCARTIAGQNMKRLKIEQVSIKSCRFQSASSSAETKMQSIVLDS